MPIGEVVMNDQEPKLARMKVNLCTFPNINVTELLYHSSNYHILLGMDILSKCNFFMAHGKFILSY